jgi:single-strand DNA-binding protein
MGSRSLNKAVIIGNVGEEPRFSLTSNKVAVCTFSVATNRSWVPKGETERKEETQWHRIVAFNRLAEICNEILTKGTKVFISGRIQNRQFENANDKTSRRTEIVASEMIAFGKRKGGQK